MSWDSTSFSAPSLRLQVKGCGLKMCERLKVLGNAVVGSQLFIHTERKLVDGLLCLAVLGALKNIAFRDVTSDN